MRDLLWLDPEDIVDGQGLSPRGAGGNTCPSTADLKRNLSSIRDDADDDRIKPLLSQVKGKDITELIASDREKLASVPSGGSGAVAVAVAAPTGGGATTPAVEEKKEEKRNLMKTRKKRKRRGI
ncbi:60S acidic ribosomal protein P2 [Capsicum annuum]|uniref:60S acidic ribosomal protein P2 n=1 Tax=Capsicum annuum TaxID=4072 RepID=A0A2G2YRN7_CAPAN|nr:60S acidic ribosomal protein P2 [Capsicum annuum]PHT72410.1 60S acidic ribosomal protein P2 [Capsicum annuum]